MPKDMCRWHCISKDKSHALPRTPTARGMLLLAFVCACVQCTSLAADPQSVPLAAYSPAVRSALHPNVKSQDVIGVVDSDEMLHRSGRGQEVSSSPLSGLLLQADEGEAVMVTGKEKEEKKEIEEDSHAALQESWKQLNAALENGSLTQAEAEVVEYELVEKSIKYWETRVPLLQPPQPVPREMLQQRLQKKCQFVDGCNRQPCYGYEISEKKEKKEKKKRKKSPSAPSHRIPRFCRLHCLEGMVNVKSRRCGHVGCDKQPLFGPPPPSATSSCSFISSSLAIFCAQHKKAGHVDLKHRRCLGAHNSTSGCNRQPTFGPPMSRAIHCRLHASAQDVDLRHPDRLKRRTAKAQNE